jgi:uncharacterized protein (DUF4213/DUF364 family)
MTEIIKNLFLNETVALVEQKLGGRLADLRVERAVFGLFFSGVKLSNGCGGLAFTQLKELPYAVCCASSAEAMPLSGKLSGRSVSQYLTDLNSTNILKKTLALSVLNALSATYWQSEPDPGYKIITGQDAFDEAHIPDKGLTVVIGALVPMLKRLLKVGADFIVLEQDPSTLKPAEMPYFRPADQASEVVPKADLLVITGVTILNDTLPKSLEMAKPGTEIIVAGPTASMLPDAFFKRGVNVMGGILVTKADELLDLISEAGSGYHFFGKCAERVIIRNELPLP